MTHRPTTRRAFLAAAGAALLPGRQQDTLSPAARLQEPSLAGRPRRRITDYENDPFIVGIERGLRCTCGCNLDVYTCRTTDFTCTVSPAMHREVIALYEDGKTGEEIVADFVARHGETILMAPPKRGFNWAGYLLPGVLITLTGGVIAGVLMRRHRLSPLSSPLPHPDEAIEGTEEVGTSDRDRLRAELDRLEV